MFVFVQVVPAASTAASIFYISHCGIYGGILVCLETCGCSITPLSNRCAIGVAAFLADTVTYRALRQLGASLRFEVHIDGCQRLTRALIFHLIWYQHGMAEACYLFIALQFQPEEHFAWLGKRKAASPELPPKK